MHSAQKPYHIFRQIKKRDKEPGPPYYLLFKCKICSVLKFQVVNVRVNSLGHVVPDTQTYIIKNDYKKFVEANKVEEIGTVVVGTNGQDIPVAEAQAEG